MFDLHACTNRLQDWLGVQRLMLASLCILTAGHAAAHTVPLEALPMPEIAEHCEEFSGEGHNAENLLDGDPDTEFVADAECEKVFVDFRFDRPVLLAGFEHTDRSNAATVGTSTLTLYGENGEEVGHETVYHINEQGGVTRHEINTPVMVTMVRWQLTHPGGELRTIGGADLKFLTVAGADPPDAGPTPNERLASVAGDRPASLYIPAGYDFRQRLGLTKHVESFTPLEPAPTPALAGHCPEFPGGAYLAENLLDDNPHTEFAANDGVERPYVDFVFDEAIALGAFEHVDRNDPATVGSSLLIFFDEAGDKIGEETVTHVNASSGVTRHILETPVTAKRVRWQVTAAGGRYPTVGGASVRFFTAGESADLPSEIRATAQLAPFVRKTEGGPVSPMTLDIWYPYVEAISVVLEVEGRDPIDITLGFGDNKVVMDVPAVAEDLTVNAELIYGDEVFAQISESLPPAKQMTIYILPHSHVDLGYTQLQTEIEDKQVNNTMLGIEYAEATADFGPGNKYVWNVEVGYAADLLFDRLTEEDRARFIAAIRRGDIAINGLHNNCLTGLCRPEELVRLGSYAGALRELTGVEIDAAMISDVPGLTWGVVPALSQSGIRYLSVAPNYFDRIGDILEAWENKPFYWVGPSGEDRVLVWMPYRGYAMSHIIRHLSEGFVYEYLGMLEETEYPYSISYFRWAGHGDNGAPTLDVSEFARDWSQQYEWPKLVIASTSEAFRAFEERHGDELPEFEGDWTPYWEDGAASTSRETAMSRTSAERLAAAEALWAMHSPSTYPAEEFKAAWYQVLRYSEHTWGAASSIADPLGERARSQYAIKSSYAATADFISRDLLSRAEGLTRSGADRQGVDIYNPNGWERSGLVVVPLHLGEGGSRVTDDQGQPVPSQRLHTGELALLVDAVPALAGRRYALAHAAPAAPEHPVEVTANTLDNGKLRVVLNEQTGAIQELYAEGIDANLAESPNEHELNQYLYLVGDNPENATTNGQVTIHIGERGPLVASLIVVCEAPGCRTLRREIRLVAGGDHVELINLVDKLRMDHTNYYAADAKESVNFAFPFNVPDGQLRLDVPLGMVRPNIDQIPGSCYNWYSVGRWIDLSNDQYGVTWVTIDAPLVELGGLTATLLNSQADPEVWMREADASGPFYSWVMNNHWGTNYQAWQEGPVEYRYFIRPHRGLDTAESTRFATSASQPFTVTGARPSPVAGEPPFTMDSRGVVVSAYKPADDGNGVIVRLFGAGGQDEQVTLDWPAPQAQRVYLSDLNENRGEAVEDEIHVPAWGLVTLRIEPASE